MGVQELFLVGLRELSLDQDVRSDQYGVGLCICMFIGATNRKFADIF